MNIPITLVCCTCGDALHLEITRHITFGYELYKITQDAGWYPVIDTGYSRTLVFCSENCYKKQLKKNGQLRKRLIKAKKEEP